MKQSAANKVDADSPIRRGKRVSWFEKIIFFGFIFFVIVGSVVVFIKDGFPSFREMLGIAFLSSALLLLRPGLVFGSLMGCFVFDVPWKFRTEKEKNEFKTFLAKRAKREGLWYGGTVFLWFIVYQWTPFSGHVDVFFMLIIGLPLVGFLISFILRLAYKGSCRQTETDKRGKTGRFP